MVSMTTWDRVRKMYYNDGKSIRQIARETGHARETIASLVNQQHPPQYERQEPYPAPILGPYKKRLEEMVLENQTLPRKQRWTTPRMYEELAKEGYQGAESTLRHYVGQVRKIHQIPKTYIPLQYNAGHDAQVDWGEAIVIIKGKRTVVQTFHLTLCYSRYQFMMAFPSQKQECFAAGHVAAFAFMRGVPRRISYDNLKTAVKKVMLGKERVEQERFIALRSYYLFDSHYCAPAAGHEKGIVEGMVGFGRRRYLSPPPSFDSYDELNQFLADKCRADQARQVKGQAQTIGEMYALEKENLKPLPSHPFECCRLTAVTRNRYSQIQVETNSYSVPTDVVGKQLTAKVFPFELHVFNQKGREPLAIHPRSYDKNQMVCDWQHYLPLLKQRPHALPYARPLAGWREQWPVVYQQVYDELTKAYPEPECFRMFIEILQLRKTHSAIELETALLHALDHRVPHLEGVVYWLKRAGRAEDTHRPADLSHLSHLTPIGQQTVTASAYDQLRELAS